jgi:hypothetical protein
LLLVCFLRLAIAVDALLVGCVVGAGWFVWLFVGVFLSDGFVELASGFGFGDFFEEVECFFFAWCFYVYAAVGAY